MKKVLITGSSGTIGTRLFETLLNKGYQVVGFDKKENVWHEHLQNLTIIGDLLNKEDVKKIPKDIDMIVHLAANARVYDLVVEPELALENVISTHNILSFAKSMGVKKIIFSSSREAYGNRKKILAKEGDVDIQLCESPYAASKIADEALVYSFSKCYGINYVVFRFSNVYGRYDESDRFIPLLIRKMKKDEPIEIFGKDKMLDFTYIDDCVEGIISAIKNFSKVKNNTFNLAYGKGETLLAVANLMKVIMKSKSIVSLGKNRKGEVIKYVADISKAKKILGYVPKHTIEKGLALAIEWYNKR